MITIEKAKTLYHGSIIHGNDCRVSVGSRGARRVFITRFRVSGLLRLWKRSPERFSLPIKYGMYFSTYLTEKNAHQFHTEADCLLLQNEREIQRMKGVSNV